MNVPAGTRCRGSPGPPRQCRTAAPIRQAGGPPGRPRRVRSTLLLAYYPLPKLEQLYPIVFEQVLGEKLSTLPVLTR